MVRVVLPQLVCLIKGVMTGAGLCPALPPHLGNKSPRRRAFAHDHERRPGSRVGLVLGAAVDER